MFHFGCSSATGIHLQALVPVISILIYVSRSSLKRWFLMLSVLHQLVSSKGLSMAGCLLALSGFQWVGYSSPPLLTLHYISYLRLLRYLSDHAVKCIIRLDFCSFSASELPQEHPILGGPQRQQTLESSWTAASMLEAGFCSFKRCGQPTDSLWCSPKETSIPRNLENHDGSLLSSCQPISSPKLWLH